MYDRRKRRTSLPGDHALLCMKRRAYCLKYQQLYEEEKKHVKKAVVLACTLSAKLIKMNSSFYACFLSIVAV